jgi:hypothetical protein
MRKDAQTKRMKFTFALMALTTWMTVSAAPVGAAPYGGGWHGGGPSWHARGPVWHGGGPRWPDGWHGDIRHFHEHDFVVWRGGHWIHGWHVGRFGWWWVIPGGWYFYPAPVYPYPDPYVPPVVAVQPGPPVAQAQPQAQTWYYCNNPSGYYPYVPECSSGWKPVPATPGSTPPPVS